MAFEAFLGDTHMRPPWPRALGYLASLAAHGPPVGIFVYGWLHHAMVIGAPGDLPRTSRHEVVYRIPVSLKDATWGPPGRPGAGAAHGDEGASLVGAPGDVGKRGRRGLVYREHHKSPPADTAQKSDLEYPFEGDPEETDEGEESLAGPTNTAGTGLAGLGSGDRGPGAGEGGGGRGRGGMGAGSGGGMPMAVPALDARGAAKVEDGGHAKADHGTGAAEVDGLALLAGGKDAHDPPVVQGRPVKASFISERLAKYFRIVESFPSLGESYWLPGRMLYMLYVEICVNTDGSVGKVSVKQGATPEVDQRISDAIRTWRYRPRMVAGVARPFCHPIRIEYSRQLRTFGR